MTEADELANGEAPRSKGDGFGHRLYTGESGFKFIENRRRWYIFSTILVLASIAFMVFRGLNFGVDFVGGNTFEVPTSASNLSAANKIVQTGLDDYTAQLEKKATDNGDSADSVRVGEIASSQIAGTGAGESLLIKTTAVDQPTATLIANDLAKAFGVDPNQVSSQSIDPSWGSNISNKAITALLVFLVAVSIFLRFRYKLRMVGGAIIALLHDLVVTAGIYALIGFEVTPATVIGLLTILGFSLYDTVVVFDKVDENTKSLLSGSRMTYSEATNLAINQTLMRSINTTLISLLPVGGLLFVGAGLLGAGTLKDLSLVLFVGITTGAYSSIFLASPITVDYAERRPEYIELTRRVQNRRASGKDSAAGSKVKAARKAAVVATKTTATKSTATRSTASTSAAAKAGAKSTPAKTTPAKTTPAKTTPAKTTPAKTTPKRTAAKGASKPVPPAELAQVATDVDEDTVQSVVPKKRASGGKPRPGARPNTSKNK